MESAIRVLFLDEADRVSLRANVLKKDMNLSALPDPAIGN